MPLEFTLDYALQILAEPGYYRLLNGARWKDVLQTPTETEKRSFFVDSATNTIMLRPLQFLPGWLDSADQVDSIIGLTDHGSGKLHVHPTNTGNFRVFEANLKQNPNNPWIFHSINAAGSLAELLAQLGIVALEQLSGAPINTTDSRVIAYTEEKIKGNQALFLRWREPDVQAGAGFFQGFTIGQFVLIFKGDRLQVLRDISESKDRTAFEHVLYADLFGTTLQVKTANNGPVDLYTGESGGPHERAILWLPLRRNLVLIQSSPEGKWALIDAREPPRLNGKTGDDQDWDIVEDRELLVWGYSPSVGRFQVQKIKWTGPGAQHLKIPTFTLEYTPASALTSANLHLDADTYRGTAISIGGVATPPGYSEPTNSMTDCPEPTTDPSDQSRTYGAELTFTSSADQRFTPFLYNVSIRIDRVVGTWGVAATQIGDTAATDARVVSAKITSSLKPGDSRLELEAIDESPFALDDLYFRSAFPVRLRDTAGPNTLFVGITEPNEVTPLHWSNSRPRRVSIQAFDFWKLLDTPLRDQRDWAGVGHITVVDSIVQQMGIDTTGADYPTPTADWNTPLLGINPSIPQSGTIKTPHWQPKDNITAAQFITKIAEEHAGFVVGFYPSGQFYYLPQVPVWFYNSSEVTFFKSRDANPAGPCYEDPVTFETVEPEANVVQVKARGRDEKFLYSSEFIDWGSIVNPNTVNFIGRRRYQPYLIDGQLTCPEINRIARVIFEQTRRRQLQVKFKADFVETLRVGRGITLEGQTGTWRVLSYEAEMTREGYRQATYECVLVEKGYGLP